MIVDIEKIVQANANLIKALEEIAEIRQENEKHIKHAKKQLRLLRKKLGLPKETKDEMLSKLKRIRIKYEKGSFKICR